MVGSLSHLHSVNMGSLFGRVILTQDSPEICCQGGSCNRQDCYESSVTSMPGPAATAESTQEAHNKKKEKPTPSTPLSLPKCEQLSLSIPPLPSVFLHRHPPTPPTARGLEKNQTAFPEQRREHIFRTFYLAIFFFFFFFFPPEMGPVAGGAAAGSPSQWGPYTNPKDCTLELCNIYCPQWCSGFPHDPPPLVAGSGSALSPLVVAIIAGILASSFLLLCYFVFSRYARRRRLDSQPWRQPEDIFPGDHRPAGGPLPRPPPADGLDETLISRISACRYRSGDGLVGSTDCSVCLTEFQEGESLRLLPECSHAFHLPCIDTWLKNHSSCPVCRSGVVWLGAATAGERVAVVEVHDGGGGRMML